MELRGLVALLPALLLGDVRPALAQDPMFPTMLSSALRRNGHEYRLPCHGRRSYGRIFASAGQGEVALWCRAEVRDPPAMLLRGTERRIAGRL